MIVVCAEPCANPGNVGRALKGFGEESVNSIVADAGVEVGNVSRENEGRLQMRFNIGLDVLAANAAVAEL